ncbi:hypothetical protein H312_01914 [Anncaliia algerae PRA339]|uniref:Uncharacterized protein n=1 Tax=Anncaliia algerae PRA339 TaxID=1288291 RepID=A0A059F055_9MICR|nr:hypothetical protein H312_01914 [Anncaliia algerae PRA339]
MYEYFILMYMMYIRTGKQIINTGHMIVNLRNLDKFSNLSFNNEDHTRNDCYRVEYKLFANQFVKSFFEARNATRNREGNEKIFSIKTERKLKIAFRKNAISLLNAIENLITHRFYLFFSEIYVYESLKDYIARNSFDINNLSLTQNIGYYILIFLKFLKKIQNKDILVSELKQFEISTSQILEIFNK